MTEKHIVGGESKRIFYGELEEYARGKIREHLQDLLEQEVSEWLGREKSERKLHPFEWKHLRTSNVVESPFSRVRLRTAASRRFKSQTNATCLIWKTLMAAEMSFRKLNAPELVEKVTRGTKYHHGEQVKEKVAA
jgi:hypothetical protein